MSPKTATASADDTVMMDDDSAEPRLYECCVLFGAALSQKEEQQVIKDVEGIFAEAGAELIEKDVWGRRGIAYPIKGQTEGKYIIYYYEMDPLRLKEVDTALRITKNLMRHMIIKPVKHYKIQKWGAKYEEWLKTRETVEQVRAREREAALQEKVATKAKKQAERIVIEKKAIAKPSMEEDKITEEIEKLISDDTLNL